MIWLSGHHSISLFESRSDLIISIALIVLSVFALGCFFCMFSEPVNATLNTSRCTAMLILVLAFVGTVSLVLLGLNLFLVVNAT